MNWRRAPRAIPSPIASGYWLPTPASSAPRWACCGKRVRGETSFRGDTRPRIHRATVTIDCGLAVNPLSVESQVQGGLGFGLSQLMANGAITLKDGQVEQSNFNDFRPPYIADAPVAIDVHIVPSAEAPTGAGEPPVPVISPAVVNALARLTGKRYRSLPLVSL